MNSIHYDTDLNIYVQIDSVKSVSEYDKNHWVFEGIASTEDLDLYDEVVYPESFLNSIDFFKSNGKIFFDHSYAKGNEDWLQNHGFSKEEILALKTPIGKPLDAKITDKGLYIKAVLNKEHPMAKLMWNQYLNNNDENFKDQIGLSIGAKYLGQPRKEFDATKGKYVTYLPDLLLYEVSMTPQPVNPYTKTWASVMKSMLNRAEVNSDSGLEVHTLPSESVKVDSVKDGILTIKSLVEGEDGVVYELVSTLNLKEDVLKAMDDQEKEILTEVVKTIELSESGESAVKAVSEDEEETTQEQQEDSVPQQEDQEEPEAPQEEPEAPQEEPEAPMMGEGSEEDATKAEGETDTQEAEPQQDAAMGEEEEEGQEEVSDVMDALVSQSEEGQGEGSEESTGADDAQEMVLDKLDAVLDALTSMAEMMQGESEEAPAEQQVSTDVPSLKSLIEDTVKSSVESFMSSMTSVKSVELSSESAEKLADVIKSALESAEERIVEKAAERLMSETVVTKSVEVSREQSPIVHPGTTVEGDSGEKAEHHVLKSVAHNGEQLNEMSEEKLVALKSLVSEYIGIRGHTADKSQQRARVIDRAYEKLGVSSSEFNVYVRQSEKGKF